MKKLFRNLAIIALVLGVCSFDPSCDISCDHQHDTECGYNEEVGTGCTHAHDEGITPCDNGEGPIA